MKIAVITGVTLRKIYTTRDIYKYFLIAVVKLVLF